MFIIIMVTIVNSSVVSSEQVPHYSYRTHAECDRAIPHVAMHVAPPQTNTMIMFRCQREENGA